MPDVNLMIHGRTYGVGCDDGQEKRVRELGQYIDKRVREIAGAGGAGTEAHLLVLTTLVLADEVFELREGHQQLRNQIVAAQNDVVAANAHAQAVETQAQRDVMAARQAADQAVAKAAQAQAKAPTSSQGPVASPGVPVAEVQKMQQQLFSANARLAAQAKEMDGLRAQIAELEEQLTAPEGAGAAMPNVGTPANDPEMDAKIAGAITNLAGRLETIAKRLQLA